MPACMRYYVDDSGSRDPDHPSKPGTGSVDWFGLGGVLIQEGELAPAKEAISEFRALWPELGDAPLHSYDIRNSTGDFRWLAHDDARRAEFLDQIAALIVRLPVYALACVVDRPGYNERYLKAHGPRRWQLCNTAFPIAVERAAKFARSRGMKLRVYVERSDKATENQLRRYYQQMRVDGLPFDVERSAQYDPLTTNELHETLYEFDVKTKGSLLMQFADLALWPLCVGGYDPDNRAFRLLHDQGKTVDAASTSDSPLAGTKYSCFRTRP